MEFYDVTKRECRYPNHSVHMTEGKIDLML